MTRVSPDVSPDGVDYAEATGLYASGAPIEAMAQAVIRLRAGERAASLAAMDMTGGVEEATLCNMVPMYVSTGEKKCDTAGRLFVQRRVDDFGWYDCNGVWCSTSRSGKENQHSVDMARLREEDLYNKHNRVIWSRPSRLETE